MGNVITVCQHKGGVGKTATVLSLAGYLAKKGRILVIDMDPQENTTISLSEAVDNPEETIAAVIKSRKPLRDIIIPTSEEGIMLAPGHESLTWLDMELSAVVSREWLLDRAIEEVKSEFDWIIVDTQPHFGIGTLMSAAAADMLLAPMKLDFYSVRGVNMILRFNKLLTHDLEVFPEVRFVCTMKRQTNIADQAESALREVLGDSVYKTVIPLNVRLEEAPSHAQTIATYDPNSAGGKAYEALTEEVLKDLEAMNMEAVSNG